MDWFVPLVALPGQALLILSTSNFTLHLYDEIRKLKEHSGNRSIIDAKIQQLRRLNLGLILQYVAVLLFILSSITGFMEMPVWGTFILLAGLFCFVIAIVFIIRFSLKAYRIRLHFLRSL